jgi:HAD superfamily hydrolase (TIGR01509 family)
MSQQTHSFEAVLFDLDGVIVDTTALNYRVWDEFAHQHGYTPTQADLIATNGQRANDNICHLLGLSPDDAQVAALSVERETFYRDLLAVEPLNVVAGVYGFIERLRAAGIPIAVATSAVPENAKLALTRVGLDGAFDLIVTAVDVRDGKPHPECYLKAADGLGVRPGRCVVVEDSIAGIIAGKASGARVLALATTFPPETLQIG